MPDDFIHQLEKNRKPVTYEQFLMTSFFMASFYDKFHLFIFTGNIANRKNWHGLSIWVNKENVAN
jgi:hypothetical protein